MEDKIRRLELELKHTMDNYHAACEEAFIAKQKVALHYTLQVSWGVLILPSH